MEWKDLSEEAKSIIEWVVSPITNRKQTIKIKVGDVFHKECPKFCGDFDEPLGIINIPVTQKLYQEILTYVIEAEDMKYEQFADSLIFQLKDGMEI